MALGEGSWIRGGAPLRLLAGRRPVGGQEAVHRLQPLFQPPDDGCGQAARRQRVDVDRKEECHWVGRRRLRVGLVDWSRTARLAVGLRGGGGVSHKDPPIKTISCRMVRMENNEANQFEGCIVHSG